MRDIAHQTGAVGGSTSEIVSLLTGLATSGTPLPDGIAKVFQYSLAAGQTLNAQLKVRCAGTGSVARTNVDVGIFRVTALKK